MNIKIALFSLTFMSGIALSASAAGPISIVSPDGELELRVVADEKVLLELCSANKVLMEVDDVELLTDRGALPAAGSKIRRVRRSSVDRVVTPVVREKSSVIPERYNEAVVEFADKTELQFRVYNEGMAYRFILDLPGKITVIDDRAGFIFDEQASLTFQKDNNNPNSDYEKPYLTSAIGDLNVGDMGNLPAMVRHDSGECLLFLEAGTDDYPCMWIEKSTDGLVSHYWGLPEGYNDAGSMFNRKRTIGNKDHIARTAGSREFPWKVFAFAKHETELLTNQLVYLLGEECKIEDTSWIEPGWVTFDWWARRGLYGVDFKAGVNTETAKYMIDFAAEFGLRYFLLDDGWTYREDLTRAVSGLDMAEVGRYAASKGVGLMLWVTFAALDDQMDAALEQFVEWGVKGIKIDFTNRDDQEAVNFYRRAAQECAKHRMVVDFHGAYRPDGLRRTYPNVLTREALIEFEYNGGRDWDTPDHHCMLPFIRNVAGPMDYIPGTMNNATKRDFRTIADKPMGMGTRAHALALAVIFESPLQMLSDAQPLYYRERECTEFLTQIPVEWDETLPLDGKTGDYVALARRNGEIWYTAAITDWDSRSMSLAMDYLDEGKTYTLEIIRDGINADTTANDYIKEIRKVKKGDVIDMDLAPGGGWIAKMY